jgi:hypothetical protein
MADSLWPLVGVCPSWKGNLIESAFQDLLRGMERERSRLKGSSHLAMTFRREYDLDGLTEYLEIVRFSMRTVGSKIAWTQPRKR